MNDMLVEYKPSRALRSTDSGQIVEPRVQTKHDEAAFTQLEQTTSRTEIMFKSRLKTFLFS